MDPRQPRAPGLRGRLATREFTLIPLLAIDAVLADRGITDFDKLSAVSPMEIGRWLHADALVYGEVVDYEAYYGFLIAAWRVTARVRMVSTRDGHELFSCTGHPLFDQCDPSDRYSGHRDQLCPEHR